MKITMHILTIDFRLLFAYNVQADLAQVKPVQPPGGFDVLTVTVHNLTDTVVLRCRGRLVRGEESALLCTAVRNYGSEVILDLTQVRAIDAAGIGALVSLQAAGIYLKLMNPSEPVRTVLRITGLRSVFEICEEQQSPEQITPAAPEVAPLLA
jgi:anti-anti-sigma factor